MARLIGQKALSSTTEKSKSGGGNTKSKGGTSSKESKPVAESENKTDLPDEVPTSQTVQTSYFSEEYNLHYFEFQSIKALEYWTENKRKSLSLSGKLMIEWLKGLVRDEYSSKRFYYAKSPDEVYNAQKFCAWDLVQKYRILLRAELQKLLSIKQKNDIETKRLEYNDRELGSFSFDRAAMRLRREYPPKQVRQLRLALQDNDGSKIVSDNKRSFAYFKTVLTPKPSIRIFLDQVAASDNIIYQGLAPYFLSEILIQKGYKVEVSTVRAIEGSGGNFLTRVVLKKFNGNLDANTILLASSDPRYIQWKVWFYTICQLDNLNLDPRSWGIYDTNTVRRFIQEKVIKPDEIPILMKRADSEESMLAVIQEAYDFITQKNKR